MRALSALLMTMLALVAGTATAHAETFGVERHRVYLEVPVDHYVGYTGHADDGAGVSASSGALGALQAKASTTAGRVVTGAAMFGALVVVQHALGADPDGSVLLAETVTLATISESVDKIKATQEETIQVQNERMEEVEKGLRSHSEAKEEMDKRVSDLLETVEGVTAAVNKLAQDGDRPGAGADQPSERDKAEAAAFNRYARNGQNSRLFTVEDHEALTTGFAEARELSTDDISQGGVFVPKTMSDRIIERTYELSPIRQNATVETISTGDRLDIPREDLEDDYTSGWVGEREDRPETDAESFDLVEIPVHEQYAMPSVTNRMLDDASINVQGRLERGISRRFGLKEGVAFVTGDGNKKPLGYLSAKSIAEFERLTMGVVKSGNATKLDDWRTLAKAMTALPSAYQEVAKWYWNRSVSFIAITYVDGEGRPLLNFDLIREGGSMQFLGHDVVHVDAMPAYDLEAEVFATGDCPVLFADMEELYTIVDKAGMTTIRDNLTRKGRTKFYTTRRVGGRPVNHDAGRLIRIGA